MKLLSEHPFWPIKDGLPTSFPPLSRPRSCDVAVIGAGITGAMVAWHLVAAGFDVAVLDRREAAHGSTAGSTSLLQYELDQPLYRLAQRIGTEPAVRGYRRLHASMAELARLVRRTGIECGFRQTHSLYLASTARAVAPLRREFVARRDAGIPVEWWTRREVAARSSLPHRAAILSRTAGEVDAYRLAYGLLADARRRGALVCDRTTLTATKHRRGGLDLWTDRGVRLRARQVVMATGYEGEALAPCPGTTLHSSFAFASEPMGRVPGWPSDSSEVGRHPPPPGLRRVDSGRPSAFGCVIWETKRPYCYVRTTEDGRVIMGGLDEPFRDSRRRDRLVGRKVASLKAIFRRWFPAAHLEVATGWAGTFAETADSLPYIGPSPKDDRTWLALGYGANGITFSLIAAEMIVAGISGRPIPNEDIFGIKRSQGTQR